MKSSRSTLSMLFYCLFIVSANLLSGPAMISMKNDGKRIFAFE